MAAAVIVRQKDKALLSQMEVILVDAPSASRTAISKKMAQLGIRMLGFNWMVHVRTKVHVGLHLLTSVRRIDTLLGLTSDVIVLLVAT